MEVRPFRIKQRVLSRSFDVLQWNLLAAPYTKYNCVANGCIQGHGNSDETESLGQTYCSMHGTCGQDRGCADAEHYLLRNII